MIGFNVSEAGHPVPLITPISQTAALNGQRFSMKGYDHASIIIMTGLNSVPPASITLKQYAAATGGVGTAIPFRYYKAETTPSGDVLSGPTSATTAGFVPLVSAAGAMYVIEIDSPELGDSGLPYLELVVGASTACLLSAVAVLSAGRQQYQGSASQVV